MKTEHLKNAILILLFIASMLYLTKLAVAGYTNYVFIKGAKTGYQLRRFDEMMKTDTDIDSLDSRLKLVIEQ